MIEAKVVLDSISEHGKRITTFKLRYPKFIHGELMTHRVLSRNASSSRAVPTAKLLAEVRDEATRATFVHWGAEQKGMGASNELTDDALQAVQYEWSKAARQAAGSAEYMMMMGASKQLVNRLLEPFSHINVVVSATEWSNFFGLRLDKAAQPEMRALAVAMLEARQASDPRVMYPSKNWHLPFFEPEDWDHLLDAQKTDSEIDRFMMSNGSDYVSGSYAKDLAIKVSVARCARVSYESFETGKRSTVEEDLKLYERLVGAQPLHASPAEHQATPDRRVPGRNPLYDNAEWEYPSQHGNFRGWRQFRKMLPHEAVAPIPEEFR